MDDIYGDFSPTDEPDEDYLLLCKDRDKYNIYTTDEQVWENELEVKRRESDPLLQQTWIRVGDESVTRVYVLYRDEDTRDHHKAFDQLPSSLSKLATRRVRCAKRGTHFIVTDFPAENPVINLIGARISDISGREIVFQRLYHLSSGGATINDYDLPLTQIFSEDYTVCIVHIGGIREHTFAGVTFRMSSGGALFFPADQLRNHQPSMPSVDSACSEKIFIVVYVLSRWEFLH